MRLPCRAAVAAPDAGAGALGSHDVREILRRSPGLRDRPLDRHRDHRRSSRSCGLPIAQYPEVVPPTVQITATYPGASAKVVAETVAGADRAGGERRREHALHASKSTNDGQLNLDVTFRVGTNLDFAQVLTQNRVAIAEAKLPEEVKRQGVTVKKKSPMILHVREPALAGRPLRPALSQQLRHDPGEGRARAAPGRRRRAASSARATTACASGSTRRALASRNMTANDVLNALREQNVQVAAGRIGQPPAPAGIDFQYTVNTLGRLLDPGPVRARSSSRPATAATSRGSSDVGRVELGREELRRRQLPRRRAVGDDGGLPAARRERARHRGERARARWSA